MYKPTENEKNNCMQIVKEILNIEEDMMCEKYVNDIIQIAYSIGCDYSKKSLMSIAEAVLKDV